MDLQRQFKLFFCLAAVLVLLLVVLIISQRFTKSVTPEETPARQGGNLESIAPMGTAPRSTAVLPEETLPIILTNTPTPTPTPSPTPSPSPTPTPSPTPRVDLARGTVNREGNLRSEPSSGAKVKRKIAPKTEVVVHEVARDSKDALWYFLSIEKNGATGWMRDYLIDLPQGRLSMDRPPQSQPVDAQASLASSLPAVQTESEAAAAGVLGTAVTNRDVNVRVEPKQKAKIARQLSQGVDLQVLGFYLNDNVQWYEVRTPSGLTHGFIRAYALDVRDMPVTLEPIPYGL